MILSSAKTPPTGALTQNAHSLPIQVVAPYLNEEHEEGWGVVEEYYLEVA